MTFEDTRMARLADVMRRGVTRVRFKIPEAKDKLEKPVERKSQGGIKRISEKPKAEIDTRPDKKLGEVKRKIGKAGLLGILSDAQKSGRTAAGTVPGSPDISFPSPDGEKKGRYSVSRPELGIDEKSSLGGEFGKKGISAGTIDKALKELEGLGGGGGDDTEGGMPGSAGPQVGGVTSQGITASGDCRSFKSIAERIRSRRRGIKTCYDVALRRNPRLEGSVLVRFTITPYGKVDQCRIMHDGTTITSNALLECIVRRIRGWEFNEAPECGDVVVEYGFRLSAPK